MTFSGAYGMPCGFAYRAVDENGQSAPAECGFAVDPASLQGLRRCDDRRSLGVLSHIFGMPPPGNIPPMPRIIFAIPPLAVNFFIIFCICLCCLIKRPMSCT